MRPSQVSELDESRYRYRHGHCVRDLRKRAGSLPLGPNPWQAVLPTPQKTKTACVAWLVLYKRTVFVAYSGGFTLVLLRRILRKLGQKTRLLLLTVFPMCHFYLWF